MIAGRFRPRAKHGARDYDFWWIGDTLWMRLPCRGRNGYRHPVDHRLPPADLIWVSGPREAPTVACQIEARAAVYRGMAGGLTRVEWAGMLVDGLFLSVAPEPRR